MSGPAVVVLPGDIVLPGIALPGVVLPGVVLPGIASSDAHWPDEVAVPEPLDGP
ncbi:hypothetical protein HEP87_49260 [Streptomyces sp. S1D4-11]|nr:hypothetical protein [Streptomyces sp. S1D4-11]QIZ00355.1 hypothetical protein HEP87_49260 [Streptomyces sp. S1D4-11]